VLILLNGNHLQALEKISTSNNWFTLTIMFLFMGIVLLKGIDPNRLKASAYSLFNVNYLKAESKENNSFFDGFQIVLFLFSVIVISLLAFSFKTYSSTTNYQDFSSFLSIFLVLVSYFITLRTLTYLFSNLFLVKNELSFFIISKYNYLYAISFLLYIAIVLNEYANLQDLYLYYFAVFLFFIRFVIHVATNKNLIFKKLFYFILYICAFEIAPLFILFKLLF
jgi:hypothetical protein